MAVPRSLARRGGRSIRRTQQALCDVRGNAKVFVFSRYGVRLIERNFVAYATEFGSHSASLRIAAFICFWPTGQFASAIRTFFSAFAIVAAGVEIGWLRRSDQRACDIPMKQPVILAIEKLGKSVTKWEFGTAVAPAPVKRVYKTGLSRQLSPEQLSPCGR